MFYINIYGADIGLIAPDVQEKMDASYNTMYFHPWHQKNPKHGRDMIARDFEKYEKNPGYGENGRRHNRAWIEKLVANAHLKDYPNASERAITVDVADLRELPTHRPHYFEPEYSSRGYPFDNFQVSSVAPNTPVYISHTTKDREWVFVEAPYAAGWMPVKCVASVDNDFVGIWERGRYAVFIKDKTPLRGEKGRFFFKAPLGSIFPILDDTKDGLQMIVAVADSNRKAVIKSATVSKEAATQKPLKLTSVNLALLSNQLINEAYGWGGVYQNRDCSAMIKDLFAPFGIWLPRNSADQAREGGAFIDLRDLSPEEKELMILKYGVPYLTLLWREGHIMLYIGSYGGRALVFHNMWGVRTKDMLGKVGKKVVGHAAITTLHPGIELISDGSPENGYLNGILGMTILVRPERTGKVGASGPLFPESPP